jgi:hypothetical protein
LAPRLRWAATGLVWATAPFAGLAMLDLPTTIQMQTHVDGSSSLGWLSVGLFILGVAWAAGAIGTSQLHQGRARAVHLTGCGLLAALGLGYPYIYGLIGYLLYRDA